MSTLAEQIDAMTVEGDLYEQLPDGAVRCFACGHRCLIRPGKRGICKVRFNQDGVLRVPWGYVAALQCDPTEKKPFFHLFPGSETLTFGMLGCDFHCVYCQNWVTSQALRDPLSEAYGASARRVSPGELVNYAVGMGAQVVASSYNEPLITSEWAVAVFKEAKKAGLHCAFVSNGNATPEALEYLRPYLSAYKVDLKTMQDAQYRRLGGVLTNVLDTVRRAHDLGLWVEVVTLVVPGFNDSTDELMDAARFLVSGSPAPLRSAKKPACATSTPATSPAASAPTKTPHAPRAERHSSNASAMSSSAITSPPAAPAPSVARPLPACGPPNRGPSLAVPSAICSRDAPGPCVKAPAA